MNKITDITRQDIIDIIKEGVWVKYDSPQLNSATGEFEDGYTVRIPIYGRLDEIAFLSRLYDLDKMPSHDPRFSTARDDILKHTVYNDDWDSFWYFTDSRFKLSNGNDDIYILRFICEMLHPAVRNEHYEWKKYLQIFNRLLEPDGYEIIPVERISGRDIFEAHEIDHIVIPHSNDNIYAGLKPIGEGSYAIVYKFTDEFYHKDFVLKRAKKDLNKKELERFRREYDEMHKLRSLYVVEVYSYNEELNEYIMELMDFSLDKYMEINNSKMSVKMRRRIILQLIQAFKYLHSKGLLHRDISIKNVLLREYEDGTVIVKISDFGLVKIIDSDLTSENTEFKGSLNDPSLKIEGFENYNLLHELYAITLLFAFIITGKTNWARISNPNVKELIEKGTNQDKDKRFQTIEELGEAAKRCLYAMEDQPQ